MPDVSEETWERIAQYVAAVAQKAFMRGYEAGEFDNNGTYNRDERDRQAEHYAGDGFDVETVKRFHPLGKEGSP